MPSVRSSLILKEDFLVFVCQALLEERGRFMRDKPCVLHIMECFMGIFMDHRLYEFSFKEGRTVFKE